jgi:outer membrane protein assembly factor BamB
MTTRDVSSEADLPGAVPAGDGATQTGALSGPILRTWPAWISLALTLVLTQVIPRLSLRTTGGFVSLVLGAPLGAVLLMVWWIGFSRARGQDRWWNPLVYLVGGGLVWRLLFPGLDGSFLMVLGLPFVGLVWLLALLFVGRRLDGARRWWVTGAIAAAWGVVSLVRVEGTDGQINPRLGWRFLPTAEERLIQAENQARPAAVAPAAEAAEPLVAQSGDWPGFRGPHRDGRNETDVIATDWQAQPPREVWRRPVGPGWGSCIVVDGLLFTQEQRGEDELLSCRDAQTGAELWRQSTPTRFYEAISGPGPRATPTFDAGRLYVQGATGWLTCCDARTGRVIWSIDLKTHQGEVPTWGYAGSPLVVDDLVVVYVGAPQHRGTAAFDRETGELRWAAGDAIQSYSSVQVATLAGQRQLLLLGGQGLESLDPAQGTRLWSFDWELEGINRDVQPIVLGDDVWISTGLGSDMGWKRLAVQSGSAGWSVQEQWFQKTLRPYHNDCVVEGDYAYGFDQNIFTCVRLSDGRRMWRQGRYGSGQVLLLTRQKLLVVQAETGDVVLVRATPDRLEELGRISPLAAKTWNHPVVAHGRLYVRNGEELVCLDVSAPAGSASAESAASEESTPSEPTP